MGAGTRTLLGAVLLVGSWATSEAAAAVAARTSAEDEVLDGLRAFLAAVEAGDAEALRRTLWAGGGERQTQARDAIAGLLAARVRLERSARAKFGEAGAARLASGLPALAGAGERAGLARATVTIDDGRTAKVICPGDTVGTRLRRAPDGRWCVSLEAIEAEMDEDITRVRLWGDSMARVRLDRYRALRAAVEAVAAGVESGAYADAGAAEAELASRLAAADAAAERRRAAMRQRRSGRAE